MRILGVFIKFYNRYAALKTRQLFSSIFLFWENNDLFHEDVIYINM